jgi:hypothetical protein
MTYKEHEEGLKENKAALDKIDFLPLLEKYEGRSIDDLRTELEEIYDNSDIEKKYEKEQKSAEWSDDDEYLLNETIQHLEELIRIDRARHCGVNVQYYQRDIDWLKYLKNRGNSPKSNANSPHWRPSEEQMRAVFDASERNDKLGSVLLTLYNDLKKL